MRLGAIAAIVFVVSAVVVFSLQETDRDLVGQYLASNGAYSHRIELFDDRTSQHVLKGPEGEHENDGVWQDHGTHVELRDFPASAMCPYFDDRAFGEALTMTPEITGFFVTKLYWCPDYGGRAFIKQRQTD